MNRRSTFAPALAGVLLVCAALGRATVHAQEHSDTAQSGAELYRASCAACHGADGRGAPIAAVGFTTTLPDFSDCSFATREQAADWFAVAHDGGPVRSFERRMPAFGEALTDPEISAIVEYIRRFCDDPRWPRGELNFPRPLVTEKAYPEDEAVLTTSMRSDGGRAITNQFLYEKRLGAKSQFEIDVPFAVRQSTNGPWEHGLGDVSVAFKQVLFHSLARGTIVSLNGEVLLPTGKETLGLGKGVTVFEPFLTAGQALPANGFLHLQAGAELSTDTAKSAHEAFWRGAVGRTFEQGRFGRAWSPMVELLGAREMGSGATVEWDVLPQVQITLSKRQHVIVNGGVRIPLNMRAERDAQVIAYFLWDWFDGGLWDGWR